MPERDRLRCLQMGKTRHDARGMLARARHERGLQGLERRAGLVHGIAHPQPKIGRHLIVAAARGVKAPGHRADQFGQPALGGHVDVFEIPVFRNPAGLILRCDLIEPTGNQRCVFSRNDPLRTQHRHMGL